MQDRKSYIIEKAFEVFMAKGYDSASMTVLQQELKMSRGAMYRYFESKDDLFIAVINKYVFGLLEMIKPKFDDNITVIERIELTYQHMQSIGKFLDSLENIEVKFLNYTALTIQAAKIYPNFLEKLKKHKDYNLHVWKKALKNSVEKGEVRSDINIEIMAKIFAKSFDLADNSDAENCFMKSMKSGKKMMEYIYSLIKV